MQKQKGSFIITLLIIALFMFAGVFYIKTSKPQLYSAAITFVKETISKAQGLAEVNAEVFDAVKTPKGEILSSAEDINFDYLSAHSVTNSKIPVDNAVITSPYGNRIDPVYKTSNATHHGIDLAACEGSEIYSFKSGVIESVKNDDIFGNCVLINHGDISSFYAHMSTVCVAEGDSVITGQKIGVIGSTGKSTGTHLHFEIRKDSERIDPTEYLYEKI